MYLCRVLFIQCLINTLFKMKQNGLFGTGSGKFGSAVFSVNSGEQVVRQYQSNVANPNTEAQVNQRAKLKLMSQLAAALAPVIAIPKEGMKTGRNQFVSKNFDLVTSTGGVAQVSYENLQLTNGSIAISAINAIRTDDGQLTIRLASAPDDSISRVVYIVYRKNSEGKLELVQSLIVEKSSDNEFFQTPNIEAPGSLVLYAYGMRDTNSKATAKYNSYQVANATDIAQLVCARKLTAADMALTQTRGASLSTGGSVIDTPEEGKVRIYATATNGGTVEGAGTYNIGDEVTLTAKPNSDYVCDGFFTNDAAQTQLYRGGGNPGQEWPYTFTATESMDVLVKFISTGDMPN